MEQIIHIIQIIDQYLDSTQRDSCNPSEANHILKQAGILNDSIKNPGRPLRNILRKGLIPHAYRIGKYWYLPHSKTQQIYNHRLVDSEDSQTRKHFNVIETETDRSYSFDPIVDDKCQVLILGTLPGEKSLREKQYYCHSGNRIWRILANILNVPIPPFYEDKIKMLLEHGIALWDVAHSAIRQNSSDSDIQNEIANPIANFIQKHPSIKTIAFNGQTAYNKYCLHIGVHFPNIHMIILLSSSPANCKYSDMEIIGNWKQIFE